MVKKLLIGFFSSVFLILVGLGIYISTQQDTIVGLLMDKLHRAGIDLEIESADIRFWSSFPTVEVVLAKPVLVLEDKDPLISVQRMAFSMNLRDALAGRIEVGKITAEGGIIEGYKYADGSHNFDFSTQDDTTSGKMSIQWDDVELDGVGLYWTDQSAGSQIRLTDVDATVQWKESDGKLRLGIDLEGFADRLQIGPETIFGRNQIEVDMQVEVGDECVSIEAANLQYGQEDLTFEGCINSKKSGYEIQFSNSSGRLENLSSILPAPWVESIETHDVQGLYSLDGKISQSDTKVLPSIDIEADLGEVSLTHDLILERLQKGRGRVSLFMSPHKAGQLTIYSFDIEAGKETLAAHFELRDFSKPRINITLDGPIHPSAVKGDILPDFIDPKKGMAYLSDLSIVVEGEQAEYKGDINLENMEGRFKGIDFTIEEGTLAIDNRDVELKPSRIAALHGTHVLSGSFDPTHHKYKVTVNSPRVDLYQLIDKWQNTPENTARPVSYTEESLPDVHIRLLLNSMQYGDVDLQRVTGDMHYNGEQLTTRAELTYCDGSATIDGNHDISSGRSLWKARTRQVDLHQLFKQWKDFGQDQIRAGHIRGKGSFQSHITFHLDNHIDTRSIRVIGGLVIDDGELINVPLMKKFAKYIDEEKLRHIEFTRLANVFRMENGRFELPQMFIQSNATNMMVAGSQDVENQIKYVVKVNAGQIIGNKLIKRKGKPVRADVDGLFNKHYIISGYTDDIHYRSDKEGVLSAMEKSLFDRDDIVKELKRHFDIGDRYDSPFIEEEIPDADIPEGKDAEVEYIPGFE